KWLGNLTGGQTILVAIFFFAGLYVALWSPLHLYAKVLVCFIFIVLIGAVSAFHLDKMLLILLRYLLTPKVYPWDDPRMREFYNLKDIDRDVVFTMDNRVLGVIQVFPQDLFSITPDDKNRVIAGYMKFLNGLDNDIHIVMRSTEIDVDSYLDSVKDRVLSIGDKRLEEYYNSFADFVRKILSNQTISDREDFIIIPKKLGGDIEKDIEALDNQIAANMELLQNSGVGSKRLDKSDLIDLYTNFFVPVLKVGSEIWTPVTFYSDMKGAHQQAELMEAEASERIDPLHPLYTYRPRVEYNPHGMEE
ncbi:MAG: hypothetical protein NTU61_06215, partial [Candidatus Altiarchaeota archaeon]|nr:hypothetical protein [Candidatus Altiarchaeota archaeon]